jgi:hypothetical protein
MSAEEFDLRTTHERIRLSPFLAGWERFKDKVDTSKGQPSRSDDSRFIGGLYTPARLADTVLSQITSS